MDYAPLLVLDLGLDIVDGVRGLNLEGDGFAREGLHEDLHLAAREWSTHRTGATRTTTNARRKVVKHGRVCLTNEINGGVFDRARAVGGTYGWRGTRVKMGATSAFPTPE
jgi:hypothetical protein